MCQGHAFQLPDVAIIVRIACFLYPDDKQIFALTDAMDEDIGENQPFANKLVPGDAMTQSLGDVLSPIPIEADRPVRELASQLEHKPRYDVTLAGLA